MKFRFKAAVISGFTLLLTSRLLAQSVPSLINYQGRLTDQNGAPMATGNYGIQFKLWDSATNTTGLIWSQQQNVSVQSGGVFNVILGAAGGSIPSGPTPAVNDLAFAFTSSSRFLGVTVVLSNGSPVSAIEIVPRQQLLTVPFAVSAATAGIASSVIPGSITAASLASASITSSQIAPATITLSNLAPRQIRTNEAGVGGIAFSLSSGEASYSVSSSSETPVPNLSVTLVTTGRPVFVFLSSVEPAPPVSGVDYGVSYLQVNNSAYDASLNINVYRSTTSSTNLISRNRVEWGVGGPGFGRPFAIEMPPSCVQFIDTPPKGTNSYSVTISGVGNLINIVNVRLVALEL